MVALIFIAFIALFLVVDGLMLYRRKRQTAQAPEKLKTMSVFNLNALHMPKGLCYEKNHTWIFTEKDGNVKIGVDDFLVRSTGTLTKLEAKTIGTRLQKGDEAFTLVQNGKRLTIKAPLSGIVRSCNEEAFDDAALINNSPFNAGWIYSLEPTNRREMQFKMNFEQYREWLSMEFVRLKDFFAGIIEKKSPGLSLVLQDGGDLQENILENFGPEEWEDFQSQFLNK